ncbi:hypothetical protein [Fundidesulfovibrio agrisoli]|uniref:hypothetical protein n=1 Tax=Fundidesulfovibrio agrisoli TaxID=2922717 RepID=UPI001FAC80B0|nr:hypothetical protein [Fundidesulfovibrio agrisoli]
MRIRSTTILTNAIVSFTLAFCLTSLCPDAAALAAPCDGIIREIDNELKTKLPPIIKKQLNAPSIKILQYFYFGDWSIVYVETQISDNPFLFYSGNPLQSDFVTIWSGAATIYEEDEIKRWVLENAPGIPESLADCFAWHVTKARTE